MAAPNALTMDDFLLSPDPDRPGWTRWRLSDEKRYNSTLGPMWARRSDDGKVIVRTEPGYLQGNLGGVVHGGAMLTQIDIALFVCARMHNLLDHGPAVTLDLSNYFISAGRLDQPLDAVVEIVRATGRLVFLRGLMVQEDVTVSSFSGTIRKTPPPRKSDPDKVH